jgi:hypothetical protein
MPEVRLTAPAPARSWRSFATPGVADAFFLFITLRVVFGLVAVYLWAASTLPGPCHFEIALDGWTTIPPLSDQGAAFPLVGVFQRWDACWYSKVATFGYEPNIDSANFWPLFPALMGLVGRLPAMSVALAGLIVAGLGYIAAMIGLERLVARDFDRDTARRTVVAISIWPAAFFFFVPYTESLFLATTVWAVLGARERHWGWAAAAALLASLTRIQGVFLVLPLGWEAFCAWRESRPRPPSPGGFIASLRPMVVPGLAVVAPLVGFVAFLLFSAAVTGQTPFDTQDAWGGKNFHPPWDVFVAAWQWTIDHHDPLEALNLATLALFLVLLVVGIRRLPISYTLLAAAQIALIATRIQPTPLTSTARLVAVVFPAFVVLAQVRSPRLQLAWVIASTMFLAVLFSTFIHGDWVA